MDGTVLLDFHSPWVALIQLALMYVLPRLTGLVTDGMAATRTKIAVLGVLTVVTSALTWLLDVALVDAWAAMDWTALLNVVVNAALTFFIAQGVFKGVIVPLGQADRDARSSVIQMFGPDKAVVKRKIA